MAYSKLEVKNPGPEDQVFKDRINVDRVIIRMEGRYEMEQESEGFCRFCHKTFSGAGMGRHLSTCKTRKEKNAFEPGKGGKQYKIYHLKIFGSKWYWLHIEIPANATLSDIDEFLRAIWLECCGHLSAFDIKGVRYEVQTYHDDFASWSRPPESMNKRLYTVLNVKDTFSYEYDFGSTTYIDGQVMAVRDGSLGKDRLRIMARNNTYTFECEDCGKKASVLCTECDGYLCDACLDAHGCGEEMVMPVVNSPRMGVCGYVGPDTVDDWAP